MDKYELTADMTENRQYWKMMVNHWPTNMWKWSLKVRKVSKMAAKSQLLSVGSHLVAKNHRFHTDEQWLTLAALTCNWLLKPVNFSLSRGVPWDVSIPYFHFY